MTLLNSASAQKERVKALVRTYKCEWRSENKWNLAASIDASNVVLVCGLVSLTANRSARGGGAITEEEEEVRATRTSGRADATRRNVGKTSSARHLPALEGLGSRATRVCTYCTTPAGTLARSEW